MRVSLPLRLTGSRNPGYRYSNTVNITYINGNSLSNIGTITSNIANAPFRMDMSSGYDAIGNRITNIVGFDGIYLLKYCPKCGAIKPTVRFGWSGRTTNGQRDQADCNDCRGSY